MISNEKELQATQQRITHFQDLLAQFRVTTRRELFTAMASGYRAEIEKMQQEVLDYLTRHASEFAASETS